MTIGDEKRGLRARARATRAARGEARAAEAIVRRAIEALGLAPGSYLALYAALPGELDPLPSAHAPLLALPRVRPGPAAALEFRLAPLGRASMRRGPFGVDEPTGALIAYRSIGALIVPGLLFDRWGQRLGYGGGYYDRTIARLRAERPGARVIGVGFDDQLAARRLPSEPTDQRLDELWTPSRRLSWRPAARPRLDRARSAP